MHPTPRRRTAKARLATTEITENLTREMRVARPATRTRAVTGGCVHINRLNSTGWAGPLNIN